MPQYHPFVLKAFGLAKTSYSDLTSLLIFGEYFGGYYPGLPAEPGRRKVQAGVAYSPGHHFYAFDLKINGQFYMDFDAARELLLAAGFPLVMAPLYRGALDDLLSVDVETFETTLPAQLGLPPPEKFRIAEGLVIRPVHELRLGNGRAIIKKKAKAFWEATNQHSMAQRSAAASGLASTSPAELAAASMMDFVTHNRLCAVVSKDPDLLRVGMENKLAGLLAKDAYEDFCKSAEASVVNASLVKKAAHGFARIFVGNHIAALREGSE